ncbi:liver carboxylesterase 4-like [Asterias rubens]|uniref:liver carboxylesterase 4-like n=1 Tax=Asterias rubens TaxID=7604 RepID=UPI001454EC5B|nr:liver carboxylesterase 4-like [Asterias rubens]
MDTLRHTSFVFWAFFMVTMFSSSSCNPVVDTSTGLVRGLHLEFDDGQSVNGYNVYKGIPYAEPPVGQLRFKAPVAKAQWDGVFNASSYGPSCPQRIADVATFYPEYVVQIPEESLVVAEDCLTLNVFSPSNVSEGSAAVMLWIHGGSFENGQGSGYDASALAARGQVVVVTINYRLNVFGFLCTNDESSPGNYGLLDQQLALKWVHENIAGFGGDPSRVTLIGQSAGGASASSHLYFNESRPLFQRVAAHSGFYRPGFSYGRAEQLNEKAREIAADVGCSSTSTSEELVDCLRGLSMEDLLAAALRVSDTSTSQIFSPVFDGIILSPTTGYLNLQHDIMVLHTSGDGSTGLEVINRILQIQTNPAENGITESEWEGFLKYFGSISSVAINYEYLDRSIEDANLARMKALTELFLDSNFLALLPGALEALPNASSIHVSVFDHRSAANTKWPNLDDLVPHSEEISYLFGLPFNGSGLGSLFTDDERALSDRVIKYWSNFAKSGDPNVDPDQTASSDDGLTFWPQYGDSETYLLIGSTDSTVGEGYRRDKVSFWTSYIPYLRLEAILSCIKLPGEGESSYYSSYEESDVTEGAGPDQLDCDEFIFGDSLGFKVTIGGAETLIELLLFAIIALLVILVLSFGAVLGYKFKGAQTASKKDVPSDEEEKRLAVKVNEGFEDDSKI